MLVLADLDADFSRGVQVKESATYFSRPTPTLPFADGSTSAQRVRWFSPQRILIYYSNFLYWQ